MELALYDRELGYYARAARRSGRAGDFFTSVDVGSLFGEILEIQLAEMAAILDAQSGQPEARSPKPKAFFDLVEAGAGNGRLAADILRAARGRDPLVYDRMRLHLVEASAPARAAQRAVLDEVADRLASSSESLPDSFEGAIVANELLDALPVHQVVMRPDGLREVYVDVSSARLVTREGPLSTAQIIDYLDRLGVVLEPGWRIEINLRAISWIGDVARRLRRGFVILIDYGHEARELYSAAHAGGTLTAFARHTMAGAESPGACPSWLQHPGEQDITAHVDFTAVRAAAEVEGLTTLGFLDQTYFLLGLVAGSSGSGSSPLNRLNPLNLRQLKTLVLPGGLGSTHKVLILGKGIGTPALRGCSYTMRVT